MPGLYSPGMATVKDYIEALLAAPSLKDQVTCHRVMEAEPPKYGETRRPWSRAMQDVLYARPWPWTSSAPDATLS